MTDTVIDPAGILDLPAEGALRAELDRIGLPALITERTRDDLARIATRMGDPMAADSRASYAAWLRRTAAAWAVVGLPPVDAAAIDWPLASVRPQCLDAVGLIAADLRELAPRTRPTVAPASPGSRERVAPGVAVAAATVCLRVAQQAARLLGPATALTAGRTATGSSTRYLTRCAEIADRAGGLDQEVTTWGAQEAGPGVYRAVLAAERFTARLADALEASTRTGW